MFTPVEMYSSMSLSIRPKPTSAFAERYYRKKLQEMVDPATRKGPISEEDFHDFCDSAGATARESEITDENTALWRVVFGVFDLEDKPLAYREGSGSAARYYQVFPKPRASRPSSKRSPEQRSQTRRPQGEGSVTS
jgi:hypothetical protein